MKKITIIDYGSGNVLSAQQSFIKTSNDNKIESKVIISNNISDIKNSTHVVLPGQESFSTCMQGLKNKPGLIEELYEFAIINLITAILIFAISVLLYRLMVHGLLDNYRTYGGNIKNIAIIGYDKKGINLYNTILKNPHLGYRSKGVFYKKSKSNYKIPYMGKISNFLNQIDKYSEVYISDEIPNKLKKEII